MITLKFSDGSDRRVPAAIRSKLATVIAALSARLTWWMLALQQKIQNEKLSGQVLQQRTGKLRNSIVAKGVELSGTQLVGTVEGAGGPAFYGQFHELGGRGPYEIHPVNKQALAFFSNGGPSNARAIVSKMRAGKASGFDQFAAAGGIVRKSVMHPAILQRQFMSNSLAEMSAAMVADLERTAGVSAR